MTLAVDLVDSTGLVGDREGVRELVEAVLKTEGVAGGVVVAFVDEASMIELNSRYRRQEGSTDVLAFDYATDPGFPGETASEGVTGEIVVCPQVVVRYAEEEGRNPDLQLSWTLIHGALHLAGFDHETDHGEMREREQGLLKQFGRFAGLLGPAGARG